MANGKLSTAAVDAGAISSFDRPRPVPVGWTAAGSSSRLAACSSPADLVFSGPEAFAAPATSSRVLAALRLAGAWLGIASELFKARLTFLVLVTTLVGFYLGARGILNGLLMIHTLLGTALVAAGASALNQWWERDHDALMRRTKCRPLPARQLMPATVMLIGIACAAVGLFYLAAAVNLATCLLGSATLLTYVLVYTPLKRLTWLNTAVGAIPGGLPPLMGWTAAHGQLSAEGWTLFAILALWQLPHFMAIAWIYRDEYANAGFQMLPRIDPRGVRTSRQALVETLALLPLSLCPFFLKMTGSIYFSGALLLGLAFIWFAARFARHVTITRARHLFLASICYLPLLLALMALDKAGG